VLRITSKPRYERNASGHHNAAVSLRFREITLATRDWHPSDLSVSVSHGKLLVAVPQSNCGPRLTLLKASAKQKHLTDPAR
jgi:hypothetical protein